MQELNGANPWHISITGDYGLNFASYAGCAAGARRGPEGQYLWPAALQADKLGEAAPRQEAFEQWWQELVQYKAECFRTGSTPVLLQPPGFENIADAAWQKYCAALWPDFIEWWNMEAGGQIAMQFWEDAPDIYNYINEFEFQTGRNIGTFTLQIDLVYGIQEPVEPVRGYLLVPPGYRYLVNKQWWLTLFHKYG